ncbi:MULTISPECIES: DUF58 domain-containing protein [unclassified Frankia]|uniref:DUF58 domain-containing protein n=2 Tax=Frankia TaxID=1854 RepID=UPI001EF6643E|nr:MULTISPECIES: DUF58 domain-containing protein [unclassified Frankia]
MLDFLAAMRALTIRGLCFVATGLACCALAATVGEEDLLRVGMLLLALPVCAAAFVCKTRYRLACHRLLVPARVAVGGAAAVSIRIDNMSGRPSSVLLVDDEVPDRLGLRARFVLDRVEAGGARYLTYKLRPQLRGRYLIGPMAIRITDPFGLCELTRTFRSRDELIVTPPVETLPLARPGSHTTISTHRRRRASATGIDDFSTRPYHPGDDLRRVHWRTSARTGELMVRQEESFRPSNAALFLDTRSAVWAGQGPMSSFEWAVGAAASIAVYLTGMGKAVRLICDNAPAPAAARGSRNPAALLDELAVVNTTDTLSTQRVYSRLRTADSSMVVAILGRTDPAQAVVLARARPRDAAAIVLLVNVATWDEGERSASGTEGLQACRAVFQRHGWTVIIARYGDRLTALWPGTTGKGPARGGGTGAATPEPAAGGMIHDSPRTPDPTTGGPGGDAVAGGSPTSKAVSGPVSEHASKPAAEPGRALPMDTRAGAAL